MCYNVKQGPNVKKALILSFNGVGHVYSSKHEASMCERCRASMKQACERDAGWPKGVYVDYIHSDVCCLQRLFCSHATSELLFISSVHLRASWERGREGGRDAEGMACWMLGRMKGSLQHMQYPFLWLERLQGAWIPP